MGITERRKREKEALCRKIIDAAREIFVKEGYEAVTMRRIADKIEYSATAIYSHFKDKDALIRAITYADFHALTVKLHELGSESDPVKKLWAMGMAYIEFGINHPNQYRLIFMTQANLQYNPEAAANIHGDPEKDPYAWVIYILREALSAGRLNIPEDKIDLHAQTLWGAFHGLVALHISMHEEPWVSWTPLRDRAELLFNLLITGLIKQGSQMH